MAIAKHAEEITFLSGPHTRGKEFVFTLKVLVEFIKGFRKFHFLDPCVTVFGSARFTEEHPYYIQAREIGKELVKLGFTVMTGGGPGIMEAANRGAKDAGGRSAGCNIRLPKEQHPNPYLDRWVEIKYFFIRKILLTKYSYAFVVMPGGFGTLDEFFEAITLMQTNKMKHLPVVLFGKAYHEKLQEHFRLMVTEGTINEADLSLFLFTDSVAEAISFIKHDAIDALGLKRKGKKKFIPFRFLGEM